MTIGSGIGGGLVINKQIYHGAFPGEVEVGHLLLNKQGQTLESLCSGWAIDERIRKAVLEEPTSLLAKLAAQTSKGEAKFLEDAVKKGDQTASHILNETADNLAFALSHVVHLFHPETIIIGGGLSLLGDLLIHRISLILPKYILKSFLPGPEIKAASRGRMVVPIGALELAKSAFNSSSKNYIA
jgi:glucokinase